MKIVFTILLLITFPIMTVHSQESNAAHSESSSKEPETIPALLSMLTPPEGFVVSDNFNGYIHYQLGSAILLTLIKNISFVVLAEGMTEEFYNENGFRKISESRVVTNNGTKGIAYKLLFVLEGREFIRYIAYIGDLNQTLWINITYPKMADDLIEDEIMKSIHSTTLNNTTRNEKDE